MPRRPDPAPFGSDPADFFGDYQDAWPADDPQAVDNAVEEYRGRHRREVPKAAKLARLRKAFRRG